MDELKNLNKVVIVGIIVNEPEAVIKYQDSGLVKFKINNQLRLGPDTLKETAFWIDLYTKGCMEEVKKFKIGDTVGVDGKIYASLSGNMTYLNIRADKLYPASSQPSVATVNTHMQDLLDEDI